ncbi:hypothetical protein C1H76_1498 [Elsinoe australis]|uniref:Inhibitor I9 domain-containing protein n=1 Tax=Elsinoe australis TaxID=40998 RepID=A0A2P8ABS4_9PEZI|nr:hypothetical protein B9Z65_9127 [Elsinoe australis]TKX26145.1 hypothetical protein C1H76_1498 [Elsinoe australis]
MASAAGPMRSVLISYPKETDDSIVEQAKKDIEDAGGKITHTYTIFKGFAAQAPAQVLEVSVAANGAEIEDDQTFTTQEDGN